MQASPPIILTIAGFDPVSGAGITADIKTAAAHGCYAVACITALTVQSTEGVRKVEPVRAETVRQTLEVLADDTPPAATRIGMLASADVVKVVADFLETHPLPNVVLDPILKASSGADLLDAAGTKLLIKRLLPLATVITPNVDEAIALTGMPVSDPAQMKAAAARLHELGAKNVVVTGGHLEKAVDLVSVKLSNGSGYLQQEFRSERLRSNSTHGTGCAFATALACNLALGNNVTAAVTLTKAYVKQAIARAHPVGKGIGPVNHLYRYENSGPRPVMAGVVEGEGGH